MSFSRELKDFTEGFKSGVEIRHRRAAAKDVEMNLPVLGPGDLDKVPGTIRPGGGGGGGVGTTTAPSVTGGTPDGGGGGGDGKRPRPRSLQEAYRQGIANIESGGGNYKAVGSQTGSGDRAYGKYQIMGANIPVWTKQWLGKALTPEQFLNSSEAQDFVFDNVFGGYVKKYGLQGAARAWFGGEGAVNDPDRTDVHGKLTTGSYGRQFAAYVTNLGDLPDVSEGEMAEYRDKINPSAVWDDTGYYPEGKDAGRDETQTGAIPEESEDGGSAPTAESPEITAPEVDLTPQVQAAPQVEDEEEHYAMGGAIPDDDTQYFQTGGTPDPYNPGRVTTQMGGAGYAPPAQARRMTLPAAGQVGTGSNSAGQNWRDWGAGGTPTQMKVQTARANLAAQRQAEAAAAAEAERQRLAAAAAAKQQQQVVARPRQPARSIGRSNGGDRRGSSGYGGSATGGPGGFGGSSARSGGLYEEGGMVDGFAKGGPVRPKRYQGEPDWGELKRKAGDPDFKETVRRETRMSGRAEEAGQGARDQAARRMNVRSRGVNSTAWVDETPYVRPKAAPAVTGGRPDRPARIPTPTPRPDVTAETPALPYPSPQGEGANANAVTDEELRKGGVDLPPRQQYRPKTPKERAGDLSAVPSDDVFKSSGIEVPELDLTQKYRTATGVEEYARGGAIPDDDRPRSQRAESAGYTGRKKKKADPWAGLRTKTSEKVRKPSTKTVKRGAAKRKKKGGTSQPGRERRQQTPGEGPIPPARPQALPDSGPIPPARPDVSAGGPDRGAPGIRRPGDMGAPGARAPGDQGAPGRPLITPGATTRQPGDVGAPGRPLIGATSPSTLPQGGVVDQSVRRGVPGSVSQPAPPARQVDPNSAWMARDEAYKRRIMEDMRARGGPASPAVQQAAAPARPGGAPVTGGRPDYGPPLGQQSPGMQVFQGEGLPQRGPVPQGRPLEQGMTEEDLMMLSSEEDPERFYARGGVIPDDTDEPFLSKRSGRGGGLHNVFGGSKSRSSYRK